MAFDGNGTFNRVYNWTNDAANGIDITASRVDTEDTGFASGLSLCVTRDGQGKMAADFLPATNNLYALGSASFAWTQILATCFQSTKTQTQAWGPTAAALVDATPDKGSWTTTLSGPWVVGSNPTGTLKWERQGTQVTVYTEANIVQTATIAAALSASALPAAIAPSATRQVLCFQIEDSNAIVAGIATINPGLSVIQFAPLTVSGSRLLTTTCAGSLSTGLIAGCSFTYSL